MTKRLTFGSAKFRSLLEVTLFPTGMRFALFKHMTLHTSLIASFAIACGLAACDDDDRAPFVDLSAEDAGPRSVRGVPTDTRPASEDPDARVPADGDGGDNVFADGSTFEPGEQDMDASVTIDATMPVDGPDVPQP